MRSAPSAANPATAGAGSLAAALRGIRFSYREGRNLRIVLRDVDLELGRGEYVAVVGRSGSGKTTLLNLLAGIDQPEAGQVEVGGTRIDVLAEPARTLFRRRHVGFIYQFFNLLPTLTVAENIRLPLELNGDSEISIDERIGDLLGACGLVDRATDYPDQLSGGEQQRVAICRAMAHDPSLLLADEPTGNLDSETGHQMLNLLAHMRREKKTTLLLVTHSREVAKSADRVLTLNDGRLTMQDRDLLW